MDLNREFASLAGIRWHNFLDAQEVIEVMRARDDWPEFRKCLGYYIPMDIRDRMPDGSGIRVELVTDRTGCLRDLAIEFLGGTKNHLLMGTTKEVKS